MTDFRKKFATAKAVSDLVSMTAITAGSGVCRLISVVMLGPQYSSYQGAPTKVVERVRLEFEAFGANWPLVNNELPTVARNYTYSNASNSAFTKLWKTLNWEELANNPLQLIGEVYNIELLKPSGDRKSLDLELSCPVVRSRGANPKILEDSRTAMPETIANLAGFDYYHPSPEDWDAIFRPGRSEEGQSYNFIQNDIRGAVNFAIGPVANMLCAAGRDIWTDYEHGQEIAGSRLCNIEAIKENLKRNSIIADDDYFKGDGAQAINVDDLIF